jgi:hypothetical protein
LPELDRLCAASLVALLTGSSIACAEADPLSRLVPKVGDSACFIRTYDAAHLRQHPAQVTASVLLSYRHESDVSYPNVRILLRQKGRAQPLYVVANCSWNEGFNRDIHDKRILKSVKADAGLDCIPNTDKDSEEGGYFAVEVAPGAKGLTLHFSDYEAAWSDTDLTKEPASARFGREDRVFRLDRVDADQCRAINGLTVKWLRDDVKD